MSENISLKWNEFFGSFPAGIYLLKINRTTQMASLWCLFVKFENISHLVLVFLLLILGK